MSTGHGNDALRIPTAAGVRDAAAAVGRIVPPTPLLALEIAGATIFAKVESLQPVGAFKLRGAWWRLSSLDREQQARGMVAFSSGNHAQAIAWAAQRLAIDATIVMPRDAPANKITRTRALGTTIVFYDRRTEARDVIAAQLADARGAVLVPSFDDAWVIEGQGSAGIEATAQLAAIELDPPDLVIACCGGGGLSAGLALACPQARIVVIEPVGWDDMGQSLRLGRIVEVASDAPATACDALMTTRVADRTFAVLHAHGAQGVAVSEAEIEAAMPLAFTRLRLVLEPGGAVALAAVLAGKVAPGARTVITLSGGNVDAAQFAAVLQRGE